MRDTTLAWSGKVAIVVGGGRGVGAATAKMLASAAVAVAVAARTASAIEGVCEEIRDSGGTAEPIRADVSDAKDVENLAQRTLDAFGHIDFLINAAVSHETVGERAWESDFDAWRSAIDTGVLGTFLTCRSVVPAMLAQGSGRILTVSSLYAEVPSRENSAYATAKAGMNQFTRVLAAELLGTGVTANVVYPGIVDTPGLAEHLERMHSGGAGPRRARARGRDPAESAALLAWLCSPATRGLTGQVVSGHDPVVRRRVAAFRRWHALW